MEDNGKLILWGTVVVILLITIGIINPFLLILIITIFTYLQSLWRLLDWNGAKFEISVVIMQFSEIENFVPFSNMQQLSKTAM